MAQAGALQQEIWKRSVAAVMASPVPPTATTLLPALNEMIALTTTRHVAENVHPPLEIYLLLCLLMFASALLMGYGMAGNRSRHWLHVGCFLISLILTICITIDLEYPRQGLIRISKYDQLLINLRADMK